MRYKIEEQTNGYGESRFFIYMEYGPENEKYWVQLKTTKPEFSQKYDKDPSKEYPVVFQTKDKAFAHVKHLKASEFTVTGRWFFGEE